MVSDRLESITHGPRWLVLFSPVFSLGPQAANVVVTWFVGERKKKTTTLCWESCKTTGLPLSDGVCVRPIHLK